ncbi:hypothetical protein QQF64_000059 [Cirrhinus molitorella]|uniref:Uncharacterized protein n=1 Tax=Cirrhinus molitorella TaxID=172907 RepID=A0ABR3NXH0_9TELE
MANSIIQKAPKSPLKLQCVQTLENCQTDEERKGQMINAAILLLPSLFKEKHDELFVLDKDPVSPTPTVVVGDRDGGPLESTSVNVRMDGSDMFRDNGEVDISLALALAFSLFHVFQVEYAKKHYYKKSSHHSKDYSSSVMFDKIQEQIMDLEAIFEGDEDTTGPQTTSYSQAKRKAQECRGSRCVALITVSLGLICVLLLVFIILQHNTITAERDLIKSYKNTAEEFNQTINSLQDNYTDLMTEKHQLQNNFNTLSQKKLELETRVKDLTAEKDPIAEKS